ncbi:hypothetical protein [Qipengyuania sp. SM2507]
MIDKPFRIVGREDFNLHPQLEDSRIPFLFLMLVFIAPAIQIWAYFSDRPILLIGLLFPLILGISWIISRLFRENEISDKYRVPTLMALIGVLQISAGAYAEGFSARHHAYDSFGDVPTVCGGEERLLFLAGGRFITVAPDGSRKALAEDCRPVLYFEDRLITVDIFPI